MNQQQRFEAFYAKQHDIDPKPVAGYRMGDSYRLPGIAAHYRTFKAAEDGVNQLLAVAHTYVKQIAGTGIGTARLLAAQIEAHFDGNEAEIVCQHEWCPSVISSTPDYCVRCGEDKPAAWERDMDYRPEELGSAETEPVAPLMGEPFAREDRYIVIKRSDLAKVPTAYHAALVEPLFQLQAHLPRRESLVIESDWPEFEPAYQMIEARMTGRPATVAWFTDDHLTDKSATTWDSSVAERWRAKGWPVGELFGRIGLELKP